MCRIVNERLRADVVNFKRDKSNCVKAKVLKNYQLITNTSSLEMMKLFDLRAAQLKSIQKDSGEQIIELTKEQVDALVFAIETEIKPHEIEPSELFKLIDQSYISSGYHGNSHQIYNLDRPKYFWVCGLPRKVECVKVKAKALIGAPFILI